MGKNILIFSDGTGQAGGYMPDEARSNVYKLFRATRVCPDSSIDPKLQLAFYDGGLGSRAESEAIKITWLRRVYNLLSQATGLGITQNIIDCYAEIIRVWQPGDRIYLFGFSRGAYTVRCVGGVLKYCGVPTAVSGRRARAAAAARCEVGAAHRHRSRQARLPARRLDQGRSPTALEREKRAARFRHKYFSGDAKVSNTAPYFIGAWDTIADAGRGDARARAAGIALRRPLRGPRRWLARKRGSDGAFWSPFLLLGLGLPLALYAAACLRYKGLVSLRRYRQAFYDTRLNYAVRYARHALAIDENRASFACVPWDEEPPRQAFTDQPHGAAALQAGMVCRQSFRYRRQLSRDGVAPLRHRARLDGRGGDEPAPPDPHRSLAAQALSRIRAGPQHDERKAFIAACPRWLVQCARLFIADKELRLARGPSPHPRRTRCCIHPCSSG